ncbi:MAG: UDP-N-acetylmuramate--L-alanine ligase, partial [Nannocystaceae bacterium]|nr:UDP-N-acetylmuramate--L-alanine ligase [Nannocystaceae bacterium]
SGIAEVLLNLGYTVTGTDLSASDTTIRLSELGATVYEGHSADHLGEADVVVVSSAVGMGNPEVVAARQRKIPVIPRAEMLAELMRLKEGIAIAGSHGNTTTTSLVASILHAAGLDPTVVIGGKVNSFDSNARLGSGDVLLAEADESDGSFLYLTPTFALITNIDNEHLDHYGSLEHVLDAFVGFANRVPFYGLAVVCIDDANIKKILPRLTKRTVTYGIDDPTADYVATDVRHAGPATTFRVVVRGRDRGEFLLKMPGVHNVCNALGSIALCDEYQVPPETTRKALAEFEGVQRRFTLRGDSGGVTLVDDYGHHPTEIEATLAGAKLAYEDRRLIGVIQPHRFTRVRDNFEGFVTCADAADIVILTEIHAAGEKPIEGYSVDALADRMRRHRGDDQVFVEKDLERLPQRIAEICKSGDVVLTLGAGNITHACPRILDALKPS